MDVYGEDMCDFIWFINLEVNQGNYFANPKFEFQILMNQINWFVMILSSHDQYASNPWYLPCKNDMIWFKSN